MTGRSTTSRHTRAVFVFVSKMRNLETWAAVISPTGCFSWRQRMPTMPHNDEEAMGQGLVVVIGPKTFLNIQS